jgi:hypothetical protein
MALSAKICRQLLLQLIQPARTDQMPTFEPAQAILD